MPLLPFLNKKPSSTDIKINLVPEDPFFDTVLGKTLRWALSVGRYIVIFTELLVILSFLARFSLDRRITDLNDTINNKKMTIEAYGTLEEDVRSVQEKTQHYQQISQQTNISEVFPALTQIMPRNVILEELLIRPGQVIIAGKIPSQDSLNILINNLQLSPNFVKVSVDHIESLSGREVGFAFNITAFTKEEAQLKKVENAR